MIYGVFGVDGRSGWKSNQESSPKIDLLHLEKDSRNPPKKKRENQVIIWKTLPTTFFICEVLV